MKIITFSMWGDNPMYLDGALKNSKLAETYYPDWRCRYYVSTQNTPEHVYRELELVDNCDVVLVDEVGSPKSMINRFAPLSETDIEYFVVRDLDSRLGERESLAVAEWISEGTDFHIMRDHPEHAAPMLGGMWGAKGGCIEDYDTLLDDYASRLIDQMQVDQYFLWEYIIPRIKNATVHDEVTPYGGKPFPSPRSKDVVPFFIGQQYGSDDLPLHPEHMEMFV